LTFEDLGNLGDLLGGLGVVATLIYLAMQIRHNTESVRGAAELDAARMRMDWHIVAASHPELADLWERCFRDPSVMTPQEVSRFLWYISAYFHLLEGFWFQHKRGLLEEDAFLPIRVAIRGLLSNSLILEFWRNELSVLSPGFRAFGNELLAPDAEAEWAFTSMEDLTERVRQKA
jgi:hypothetical protein